MLEFLKDSVERFLADPSVVVSAVYRIDGAPIVARIKERKYLQLLQFFEEQTKAIFQLILDESLKSAELKTMDYTILLSPLSRTLVLVLVSTSEASIYKLKIEAESLRGSLNV
uniref:Roadblock/LAMTOR2 domain-containing protein n=1 Tax=Archaeoglobus fulgidus TaxID=2234 RepID=A0A7J3M2T0_ARCFL